MYESASSRKAPPTLTATSARPKPIAPSGPAFLRVSLSRICRNVVGLFAGLCIGEPSLSGFQTEAAYEFAGLVEWPISTKLVCNRVSAEPIAHSGPAVLRVSTSRICRDVVGLFAGLCVGEPFLLIFQAEAAHKSAGLLEWSKLVVQWS